MPLDIYPEQRLLSDPEYDMWGLPTLTARSSWSSRPTTGRRGSAGPIEPEQAFVIDQQLRPLIEGADALANERLWDRMYRYRSTAARASR